MTADQLVTEIRAWLRARDQGARYACARDYFHGAHDPKCEACLLIAAARLLEQKS